MKILPKSPWGYAYLGFGIAAIVLWLTQKLWDWYGITTIDKAMFSLLVLFLIFLAIGFGLVANKTIAGMLKGNPAKTVVSTLIIGFAGVMLYLIISNGLAIQMSVDAGEGAYTEYYNNNQGFFQTLRMLAMPTEVGALEDFALGVQQIIRIVFLVVPALIIGWGALSVLTADSIDEAEGGLLALVAAILTVVMLFLFQFAGVTMF
jgi:hypothetical protein